MADVDRQPTRLERPILEPAISSTTQRANAVLPAMLFSFACNNDDFRMAKRDKRIPLRKRNLVQEIPLTDDERAAVDGDAGAVDRLIVALQGVPTPDAHGHP